jgi:hypothetical protein
LLPSSNSMSQSTFSSLSVPPQMSDSSAPFVHLRLPAPPQDLGLIPGGDPPILTSSSSLLSRRDSEDVRSMRTSSEPSRTSR